MLVPTELFWAYLVAISLLTVTPGVDTLLVMRNAGRGGLKHGLRAVSYTHLTLPTSDLV